MTPEVQAVAQWLDHALDRFSSGAWAEGLQWTADNIHETYLAFGADRFKQEVLPLCLEHPLRALIHQDPYTRHSFLRPRGYAGDASLIDFFYGLRGPEAGDTALGQFIFTTHMQSSAARSVRERRTLLGARLETLAQQGPGRVLSVACGHLREVLFAPGLRSNPELRITALDQDVQSLGEVQRMCAAAGLEGVTTLHADLKPILLGRLEEQRWDFVYAAGLYDYLPEKLARRLTRQLFRLLAPGGTLLLANFKPDVYERGYMESYMNWYLIFREVHEMAALTSEIAPEEIAGISSTDDGEGNVTYLELQRA